MHDGTRLHAAPALPHAIAAHPRLMPPVARAKMQQSSRAMFDVTMVISIDKVALTVEVL